MAKYISNPPNPWDTAHVEWIGEPPTAQLKVYEEQARTALAKNDSPDLNFRWSLNPYRGCFHACAYCYARPTHEYLGFGAGTDFDRRIVIKTNIAERLEETFERGSWRGELVALSGNTDCYQPLEGSYGLTRACLEVMARYRNPVGIITKGSLIRRDVDLLVALAEHQAATVFMSICFSNPTQARLMEPGTPPPEQRFETMQILADAGIPVGIALAPVIPGLNDEQIPSLLERAAEAGATKAFMTPLRLSGSVRGVFEERLRSAFPERADRVLNALQDIRHGQPGESRFGSRMRGVGPRWQSIRDLFVLHRARVGLAKETERSEATPFRRPTAQTDLFC